MEFQCPVFSFSRIDHLKSRIKWQLTHLRIKGWSLTVILRCLTSENSFKEPKILKHAFRRELNEGNRFPHWQQLLLLEAISPLEVVLIGCLESDLSNPLRIGFN